MDTGILYIFLADIPKMSLFQITDKLFEFNIKLL
jgi:hypothetical protein